MENELSKRVSEVFGELVVNKKAALLGGLEKVPRFVTEYLLASARSKRPDADPTLVRERIRRFTIDADRKNEFVSRLMREGKATLITLLEVEPLPTRNEHVARITQLDGHVLSIGDELIARHPELLYGGMWGSVELRYDTSGNKPSMVVEGFTPYQLARPDTEAFRRGRTHFTFDEWVDVMVTSAGYNPAAFSTLRHKLLLLCRLLPLAENNLNLVELGPRNTGKSYLLRSLSARVYLSSGARATPASFFYDLNKKRLGLIGVKKAVIFDEISSTSISDPSFAAALLDYMESGAISRGGRQMTSDCSLVFTGNIELGPDGRSPRSDYPHLFHVFPPELAQSAIVDRVHAFIPGWELPKISDQRLSDEVGFLSDYFGEVLTELRRDPAFGDAVRDRLGGLRAERGEITIRDRRAIERVMTGLSRILFPDGNIDERGFEAAVQVAIELRMRVHEQLTKISPGEYKEKVIGFRDAPAPLLPEKGSEASGTLDALVNREPTVGMVTLLYVHEGSGGGDRGFVQCAHVGGKGLSLTGARTLELERSLRTAYDALLQEGARLGMPAERLLERKMAVHLVSVGETKEAGGLAFALAMLSAVSGRPLRPGLAVTGDLALHGNVIGVAGIPEKVRAALSYGRTTVILPATNRDELRQIPELVARMEVHPVATLAEAAEIAFSS